MDTSSIKKPHKFFDRFLNNDLNDLYNYLTNIHKEILYKNIFNVPENELKKFNELSAAPTKLNQYYNIFSFNHNSIKNLQNTLKDMTIEACEYYEYNFDEQDYVISGWFNLDYQSQQGEVSPINKPEFFHDHSEGSGMPVLHGYYCVNAEPSSTFYKIDKNEKNIFENINKNNRAILSETGHPHGRDDWHLDKPRITIAYDIVPIKYFEKKEKGYMWIRL